MSIIKKLTEDGFQFSSSSFDPDDVMVSHRIELERIKGDSEVKGSVTYYKDHTVTASLCKSKAHADRIVNDPLEVVDADVETTNGLIHAYLFDETFGVVDR